MTQKFVWSLIGGLAIVGLIWGTMSRRTEQAAVAEPTAEPTKASAQTFEKIAIYQNKEFGFSLQYPKTMPCADEGDGEICTVDMSPRDLSSIGLRESIVYYLDSQKLSFSVAIEKKLPDFTSLLDLVQYRNEHINDVVSDPLILIKNVRQFTWQNYTAVASDEEFQGRLECTLHIEKGGYLYRLMFPYPCPQLNESGILEIPENIQNEPKEVMAIEMILNQFTFDKGAD